MSFIQSISIKAYAKINLSLDIVGKLENGYHELETIMQSVSLHDIVTITKDNNRNGITLTCSQPSLCPTEQNTAYKAVKAFFTYCKLECNALSIYIEKNIPSQAGLAGGSADAAAVLHGLNYLFNTNLSTAQLCEIGVKIGADVPFCICGGTMLAKGIGDELSMVSPMPACHMVICKPPVSISTQEAYQKVDNAIILERPKTKLICSALEKKDLTTIAQNLKNVFQEAMPIAPVQSIVVNMEQYSALGTCMSGSGSAVFGIFEKKEQANKCLEHLKKQFSDVFVCTPTIQGVKLQNT